MVAAYDGELTRVLFPTGMGMEGQPSGIIDPAPRQEAAGHHFIPPLVVQFVRPLDPAMAAYPLDQFTPTGASKTINGLECVEYTLVAAETTYARWLVPSRGHVVAWFERRHRGRLREEADVTYRPDPGLGWVPEAWTATTYTEAGAVRQAIKGRVTEIRAGGPFPDGHFDVTFPEGATVTDQRVKKTYRVKADGSWRELDVFGNEVPEPVRPAWLRRNLWAPVVGIVVGAVVLARVLRRRADRSHSRPS